MRQYNPYAEYEANHRRTVASNSTKYPLRLSDPQKDPYGIDTLQEFSSGVVNLVGFGRSTGHDKSSCEQCGKSGGMDEGFCLDCNTESSFSRDNIEVYAIFASEDDRAYVEDYKMGFEGLVQHFEDKGYIEKGVFDKVFDGNEEFGVFGNWSAGGVKPQITMAGKTYTVPSLTVFFRYRNSLGAPVGPVKHRILLDEEAMDEIVIGKYQEHQRFFHTVTRGSKLALHEMIHVIIYKSNCFGANSIKSNTANETIAQLLTAVMIAKIEFHKNGGFSELDTKYRKLYKSATESGGGNCLKILGLKEYP